MARTLRACTAANVTKLERASWYDLKRWAPPRHRFHDTRLGVDIDLTPMPIGARAEAVRAPGWGVIEVRRDGKRSG